MHIMQYAVRRCASVRGTLWRFASLGTSTPQPQQNVIPSPAAGHLAVPVRACASVFQNVRQAPSLVGLRRRVLFMTEGRAMICRFSRCAGEDLKTRRFSPPTPPSRRSQNPNRPTTLVVGKITSSRNITYQSIIRTSLPERTTPLAQLCPPFPAAHTAADGTEGCVPLDPSHSPPRKPPPDDDGRRIRRSGSRNVTSAALPAGQPPPLPLRDGRRGRPARGGGRLRLRLRLRHRHRHPGLHPNPNPNPSLEGDLDLDRLRLQNLPPPRRGVPGLPPGLLVAAPVVLRLRLDVLPSPAPSPLPGPHRRRVRPHPPPGRGQVLRRLRGGRLGRGAEAVCVGVGVCVGVRRRERGQGRGELPAWRRPWR